MPTKWKVRVGVSAVLLVVILVAGSITVHIEPVSGNEMGILETWGGGVADEPLLPKTYVYVPGFLYEVFLYDMSSQVYVMNDLPGSQEFAQGREKDSYPVQSAEGQDMHISMNLRWRLDPVHLVQIHKTVRRDFEEKLIRPVLMRVVKDEATICSAIEAYSGIGLVELQKRIEARLVSDEEDMSQRGIIVENFVIEGIRLDPDYIKEIKGRQVAVQKELRAKQEEQAALAEAQKAKAEAQADYERQVVAAERDKKVFVLAAEQNAEKEVIAANAAAKKLVVAAEAQKQEQVLIAEGKREASENEAAAIMALGKANADAKKLELSAWAVEGAENYVTIEIAKSMAEAFGNIDGYLPQDMNITVLGDTFRNAIDSLMRRGAPVASE